MLLAKSSKPEGYYILLSELVESSDCRGRFLLSRHVKDQAEASSPKPFCNTPAAQLEGFCCYSSIAGPKSKSLSGRSKVFNKACEHTQDAVHFTVLELHRRHLGTTCTSDLKRFR